MTDVAHRWLALACRPVAAVLASKAALAHLTAMDGGNAKGLQEQSLPCAPRHKHILCKLAPTGVLLVLVLTAAAEELDSSIREALSEAYYEFEVAGYCSLVSDAVAAGFHRQVGRILGDTVIDRATLDALRGKAWQAAHWEWQNRGLGGFRGWCRNEGRAAAERFLAEPP